MNPFRYTDASNNPTGEAHLGAHAKRVEVCGTGGRHSFWKTTFAEARRTGDWTLVSRSYTVTSARKITVDIRNAHRRTTPIGVAGILPGERWDADYIADTDTGVLTGIVIRYMGQVTA